MTNVSIKTLDPDQVAEVICIGKHNISITNGLATLTFGHLRNDPYLLFDQSKSELNNIVRARIVMNVENLVELREAIDGMLAQMKLFTEPGGQSAIN